MLTVVFNNDRTLLGQFMSDSSDVVPGKSVVKQSGTCKALPSWLIPLEEPTKIGKATSGATLSSRLVNLFDLHIP